MSVTCVLVQLPSFSHSFSVTIPSSSSILDFKNEITRTCTGAPSAAGQRVIYKGRVLGDAEVVGDVWKTADEPHVCHLAVHPSAWTATPPSNYPPLVSTSPQPRLQGTMPIPRSATAPPMPAPTPHATYSFIQYMHTNALRILARQPRLPWPEHMGDLDSSRTFARRGIEATGRGWPSFLNQDFSPPIDEPRGDEGVKYASTYIDNLPYLSLVTPAATPTPLQAHAIRVLSYTFPLLCVYPPAQVRHNAPVQVHPLPPRALVPVPAAFPQIPIRPLILPLLLLTLRTVLLLYFFQPARKPLFGLMVLIWVTWEVAGAIRGALGGENVNGGQNNRAQRAGGANAAPAGGRAGDAGGEAAGGDRRPAAGGNAIPPRPPVNSQDALLNSMACINLASEAPFVESDPAPDVNTPPPSLPHKIKMFFTLLILTLHPAIWDRRRTALRAREGRVREEARTREARALQRERERTEREENLRRGVDAPLVAPDTPEPPPPAPRPFWVAEYVQRVRSGDWVDD